MLKDKIKEAESFIMLNEGINPFTVFNFVSGHDLEEDEQKELYTSIVDFIKEMES